jgi:hypothetical protein
VVGNGQVYRVASDGRLSLIAGSGTSGSGYSGDGGPAASAQFAGPYGITVDSAGNLFIADRDNNRIRKVTPAGIISTAAGFGIPDIDGDVRSVEPRF